jgi:SAM-dependent methyltransferase
MVETAPQFFDRLADRYDQVIPFFGELAKELLDILDPAVGTRLLDLGTGRGAIATAAAARGCTVTAVDAAPRMVGLLAAAHPEIDARLMDIHDLDLPDHSYDLATAGFVVHMPIADPQTCWDFHMSHGFAAIVESLDPADAAEFRRCALAELTRMHESGGIVLDRGAVLYLAINPDDT